MVENFTIAFEHNGKPQSFSGELKQLGYTHKLYIDVNGIEVIFEPDEERNYRAVIATDQDANKIDKSIIEKLIEELKNNLK